MAEHRKRSLLDDEVLARPARLRALLAAGADVNEVNVDYQSALHLACSKGWRLSVEALMDANVRVNDAAAFGRTPLHEACTADSLPIVRMLLERGAETQVVDAMGWTPLYIACRGGRRKLAAMLLGAGADIHPLRELRDGALATVSAAPLNGALKAGAERLSGWLIQKGADVDEADLYGETPREVAESEGLSHLMRSIPRKLI